MLWACVRSKSKSMSRGRRLMEGVGLMSDDTSESPLRFQQMWEAQQRLQLLGPTTSRNGTGQGQQLQELVPALEQHCQPGATIASGVDWMRDIVVGGRTSSTPDLDDSQLPHAPLRQRLPTL